jgi:hypothetical protein
MDVLRQVRYQRSRFHAQVLYTKYFSDYQKQNAIVLGLLDRLGATFNPAILWNAAPWTFVIDWVVGVSQWLDQFKISNLEPVTVVHKFLWSTDIKRTISLTTQNRGMYDKYDKGNPRLTVFATESAYKRSTQGLNTVASLSGSGINSKEFVLAGALAASRYRG